MRRIYCWISAIVVASTWLLPGTATAHQQLLEASPAAGDILQSAPRELRLTFNQAIEPSLAQLRLVGPAGEIDLAPHRIPADAPTVLLGTITGPLAAGAYTIHWLVTGDDGHPVRGEIQFTIAEGAAGLPAEPAQAPAVSADSAALGGGSGQAAGGGQVEAAGDGEEGFGPTSPLYLTARWLTFAGITVVIGAVAFVVFVLPGLQRQSGARPPQMLTRVRSRAAGLGLAAVAILVVGIGLRLLAQTTALRGAGGAAGGDLVVAILTRSIWGWGWVLQAAAAMLAIAGFTLAMRRRGAAGWAMAAVAALVLAVTPGLSGHAAAASTLAIVADSLHVLSAGGWLGTLLVMMVAGIPLFLERPTTRRADGAALLRAFTPVALTFAGGLAITGVFAAWLHLTAFADLWSSAYGRTLLLKLGALMGVIAAGAFNWLRSRPALEERDDARPLRRSATAELAIGALVLAITAALVATPPPADTSEAVETTARTTTPLPEPGR